MARCHDVPHAVRASVRRRNRFSGFEQMHKFMKIPVFERLVFQSHNKDLRRWKPHHMVSIVGGSLFSQRKMWPPTDRHSSEVRKMKL